MQHRLRRSLALAGLAVALGLIHNACRRWPVGLTPPSLPPCPARVALQTAKDWYVNDQAVFLDTRPEPEFVLCHIAGARRQLPSGQQRVVVCGPVAPDLCTSGIPIFVLEGGLSSWQAAGCPVQP